MKLLTTKKKKEMVLKMCFITCLLLLFIYEVNICYSLNPPPVLEPLVMKEKSYTSTPPMGRALVPVQECTLTLPYICYSYEII
jgi:hypothetical protein